jgi:hypothetical protein
MATITVDQQKLVLNAFAAVFQNNLLAKDLVSWKTYDGEMDDRNGLKVSEQVGPRYNVTRTTSGVNDLTAGVQDSVFGSEQFTVVDVFGSSMGWGDFVKIRDIGSARESVALQNAATNLAETIDAYVLKTAIQAANNEVGTAGNNVATYADVLTAYTRLKKEGVDDSELRMVLGMTISRRLARLSWLTPRLTASLRRHSARASRVKSPVFRRCSLSSFSRLRPALAPTVRLSLTRM